MCMCACIEVCVCVKLMALQNQFCTCFIFTEGKRRGGRMEAQKGKEEWLLCQSVLYIHAVVLLISAGLLSLWALSSWECVSMCMCKCVTLFSPSLGPWACSEVLLPVPWNTSALSAPPFSLSSSGTQCTPYLDKAAAGWAWCPDREGWSEVRSSRLLHSQCCPRCPDELRCGVDTTLCQAVGFEADHRLS